MFNWLKLLNNKLHRTKKNNFNYILTRLRKPNNAPTNVSGTDTQNHNNNKASSVENGIAAELSLTQRTKFIMKNRQNTTLKKYNNKLCKFK